MGLPIIIYGKSGAGKTRSLKNFGTDEIFYVNVAGKALPFKKRFKYTYRSANVTKISECLGKMPTKTAVIDDTTYIMIDNFMWGHSKPKVGASQFDLYNDIADEIYRLLNFICWKLPQDTNVYLLWHEDTNDYGDTRLRTIGKLLDQKVCIEGLSTIVLRCCTEGTEHFFSTITDGRDITKAPEEMFDAARIPNDLKAVDVAIREFYAAPNANETKKGEEANV